MLLGDVLQDPLGDARIEVRAAEVRISAGGDDVEDVAGDLHDRDVEADAAHVDDDDPRVAAFVVAVGERDRGGLVHQLAHLEPGELAGLAHGGLLHVVEVRGHCDHALAHVLAEVLLGEAAHLIEQDAGDFGDP